MIICNTTPLIALASINSLEILSSLTDDWCVPEAVFKEATLSDKPFSKEIFNFLTGKVKKVEDVTAVED